MKGTLIGLAGELYSGKGTAARFYEQKFKAKNLRFSKILDVILNMLDLPNTRENEQDLATVLRQLFGEAVLVPALLGSLESGSTERVCVIDGIRKMQELNELRKYKNFKLIFIKSSFENRFKRLRERDEKHGEKFTEIEEFKKSQMHEADKELANLENYA